MISLKDTVFHSYTVGIRVVFAHTGRCPKEQLGIKKSFDHSAVGNSFSDRIKSVLFGVIFLTMQLVIGMVKLLCRKTPST